MSNFIKKNVRVIAIFFVVILLSAVGVTLAINANKGSNINLITKDIVPNIKYDKDSEGNDISVLSSEGVMTPVTIDTSDINTVMNKKEVLKLRFWVSGNIDNPEESIYDIALHNVNIDCELKDESVKWLLYKNNNLLYSGNFSPMYDAMPNNRLLLTDTQQDLTLNEDEYLVAIYIEDSCPGDINECKDKVDQSNLLGKTIKADISIETSTKSKVVHERITTDKVSCNEDDTIVNKPVCNPNLIYNGSNLTLTTFSDGIEVNQNSVVDAGKYNIIAKLAKGYKWDDNTNSDYILTCTVKKRSITISTLDQDDSSFASNPEYISTINLVEGHKVNSIKLERIKTDTNDIISPSRAIIYDQNGNDVTSNYSINYQSVGRVK